MSPLEIETMRAVEDDLWWYRGLRGHVIASLAPTRTDFKLLDAGCGSGGMLARLRRHFPAASLTGLDYVPRALELTAERGLGAELIQGSADDLPFPENAFDVVLSLDVIILRGIDDQKALHEMHRVLRPGGTLLINVPAFNFLRGSHDAAVSIARRYTRPRLVQRLRSSGFSDHRISYWNMTLLPAVAAVRWASRKRAQEPDVRSDLAPLWPPLNRLLSGLTRTELALSRRLSLPFGTSLFAVAYK